MTEVVIGLGSNLGAPEKQLQSALRSLRESPHIRNLRVSDFVRSAPLAGMDQPDYCNAVSIFDYELAAEQLLQFLQALEDKHGRQRSRERWSARPLDLDILQFGDRVSSCAELSLPHPQIVHRSFVVQPWLQLDPEACLPDGRRLREMAVAVSEDLSYWDQPDRLFRIM